MKDTGKLQKDLITFGELFEQDSILFIPKGAVQGGAQAYLIGTNNCPDNWLNMGQRELFNKGKFGYDSKIYTSYVNGRPFIFEQAGRSVVPPGNGMGWWACHVIANKKWTDLDGGD